METGVRPAYGGYYSINILKYEQNVYDRITEAGRTRCSKITQKSIKIKHAI
jgi:hypothetical protein